MALDTGLTADAGRRLLRGAEALGGEPVAIVNSHAHADHFGGNALLLKRTAAKVHAPAQKEAILGYPDLEPFCLFGAAPRDPRLAGEDPGAGRSQPAQPGSDPKGDSGRPGESRPGGGSGCAGESAARNLQPTLEGYYLNLSTIKGHLASLRAGGLAAFSLERGRLLWERR